MGSPTLKPLLVLTDSPDDRAWPGTARIAISADTITKKGSTEAGLVLDVRQDDTLLDSDTSMVSPSFEGRISNIDPGMYNYRMFETRGRERSECK
jgi:hypothetical protein